MAGAAAAVASGAISREDVRRMLDEPIVGQGWNERARTAPAQGLYLADVVYPPECLVGATDDVAQLPIARVDYQADKNSGARPLTDKWEYPEIDWCVKIK